MQIIITNLSDGDILPHSLALLTGVVTNACSEDQEITVQTFLNSDCNIASWPIFNGKFKALIKLVQGKNKIVLCCGRISRQITLSYHPRKVERFVRLVYVMGADGYGRFQSPKGEPNTLESACSRIILGAQMIQTFIAEEMNRLGVGRKTFCLELGNDNQPKCHAFRLSVCTKEAEALNEKDLWTLVAKELMNSPLADPCCKYLAFLSFTKYSNPNIIEPSNHHEVIELTKGHATLGGGGLALLGTGCLHTWARCIQEVQERLRDERIIDWRYLMDHSNYRGYYWACYATTLGAACHELCHTFNLGHNNEGIMGRGFNDFHRVFIADRCLKNECCQTKKTIKPRIPVYCRPKEKKENASLVQNIRLPHLSNKVWSSRIKCELNLTNYGETVGIKNDSGRVYCNIDCSKEMGRRNQSVESNSGRNSVNAQHLLKGLQRLSINTSTALQRRIKGDGGNRGERPPWKLPEMEKRKTYCSCNDLRNCCHLGHLAPSGAYLDRSSALLLNFHKWLNSYEDNKETLELLNGHIISSSNAIRVLELRDEGGNFLHYFGYLEGQGPNLIDLKKIAVKKILQNKTHLFTLVAEDSCGNMLTHTMSVSDL